MIISLNSQKSDSRWNRALNVLCNWHPWSFPGNAHKQKIAPDLALALEKSPLRYIYMYSGASIFNYSPFLVPLRKIKRTTGEKGQLILAAAFPRFRPLFYVSNARQRLITESSSNHVTKSSDVIASSCQVQLHFS